MAAASKTRVAALELDRQAWNNLSEMRTLASILLLLAVAFSGSKSPGKKPKDKKAVAQAKKDAQATEDSADVDFQAFVNRLRRAVDARGSWKFVYFVNGG